MYTSEERDTFSFCMSRCVPEESDRQGLRAFVEALEHTNDARGVTPGQVAQLIGRSTTVAVGKLLGEVARDTREHGVPVAVDAEPDGMLRYWLTPEQVGLVRLVLRSRAGATTL
jgi:hypothetical protein